MPAGKLGGWLRPYPSARLGGLRSSDIREFAPALAGEDIAPADLSNGAEVDRLFAGAGAIIHFGALGAEDGFERILESCIVGTKNIRCGIRPWHQENRLRQLDPL